MMISDPLFHEIERYLGTILYRIEEELDKEESKEIVEEVKEEEERNNAKEENPSRNRKERNDPRYGSRKHKGYQSTEETFSSVCELILDGYDHLFQKLYSSSNESERTMTEKITDLEKNSHESEEKNSEESKVPFLFLFSPPPSPLLLISSKSSSSNTFQSHSSILPYLSLYLRFSTYLLYYIVPIFHLWLETPEKQKHFIYLVSGLKSDKMKESTKDKKSKTRPQEEKLSSPKVILPIAFLILSLSDTLLTPSPPSLSSWAITTPDICLIEKEKDQIHKINVKNSNISGEFEFKIDQNSTKNNRMMKKTGEPRKYFSGLDRSTIYSYLRLLSEVWNNSILWNLMIFQLEKGFSSHGYSPIFKEKQEVEQQLRLLQLEKNNNLNYIHLEMMKEIWSRILTSIVFLPQRVAGHLRNELPLEYRQEQFYAQLIKSLLCNILWPIVDRQNEEINEIYGSKWNICHIWGASVVENTVKSTSDSTNIYLERDSFYYQDIVAPMINKLLSLGGTEMFSHLLLWIANEDRKKRKKNNLDCMSPLALLFTKVDIMMVEEVMKELFSCLNLLLMYHFVEASIEPNITIKESEQLYSLPPMNFPTNSAKSESPEKTYQINSIWDINEQNPYFKKLYDIWDQFGFFQKSNSRQNVNQNQNQNQIDLHSSSSHSITNDLDFKAFSVFLFSIITVEDGRDLLWEIIGHRLQKTLIEQENTDTFGHLLVNQLLLRKDIQSKFVLRILAGILYLCDKQIRKYQNGEGTLTENSNFLSQTTIENKGNEENDVAKTSQGIIPNYSFQKKGINTFINPTSLPSVSSTSLVLSALYNLSNYWNSRTFLHQTDIRRQACISSTIIILLSFLEKKDLYENPHILNNIIPGVGLHLESTIP